MIKETAYISIEIGIDAMLKIFVYKELIKYAQVRVSKELNSRDLDRKYN